MLAPLHAISIDHRQGLSGDLKIGKCQSEKPPQTGRDNWKIVGVRSRRGPQRWSAHGRPCLPQGSVWADTSGPCNRPSDDDDGLM